MKGRLALLSLVLISLSLSGGLAGQTFISAKAGLVNYEEGVQASSPRQLQEGEIFSTPNRSELLMMPGAYVRLERSAEVRMLSTSISHPELELLSGLISIEINELPKESSMSLSWGDYHDIAVTHRGLYRFEVAQDGTSTKVMVQTGQLRIGNTTVKDGEEIVLASGRVGSLAKFDRKLKDDFDIWAANRDQLQSVSSYRTASAVGSSYYQGYPGMMGPGFMGTWAFNPMLGYFTYLPYGMVTSPWGYYYYSPSQVGYYPFPSYGYMYGGLFGYGGYNYYGYAGGYATTPAKQAIGTTPAQSRFPVYGTTGGNGSSGFAGTSPRSGVAFSGNNAGSMMGRPSFSSGGSGGSMASSGSSGGFAGSAPRAGSVSSGGSGGAAPTRH